MEDISGIIDTMLHIRKGTGYKLDFSTSIENYEKLEQHFQEQNKLTAGTDSEIVITTIGATINAGEDKADVEMKVWGVK